MQATSLLCALAALLASACAAQSVDTAIIDFNQGRYTAAIAKLRPASSADPRARVYLALSQAAAGDCKTALPTLTQIASGTNEVSRLSGIAAVRCAAAADDSSASLALAESLKTRFPKDADVLYVAAEIEMKAFNETTFAMFQRVPSSYRVHELSARIFEVQNRYAEAVSEYRRAIELNPHAPDLHFRLGRAILLQSHAPEALNAALEAFRTETNLSPEDSACTFQIGQIAQVQGRADEARAAFETALKQSPTFVSPMVALAKIEAQGQHYDRAIALLSRATALQPENEAAHYALLTAYRNAGQMDKAKAEKATLDRLQKPPEGEFTDFLKRLGDKPPAQ